MNKLLARQIKKFFGNASPAIPEVKKLLKVISETYDGFDEDRTLMERSLDLSSNELVDVNQKLRQEAETLKAILNELRSATTALKPEEFDHQRWLTSQDEVVHLANSLTKLINERKAQERKLIRLASFPTTSPNAILETNIQGVVTYMNPATKKYFPDIFIGLSNHPVLEGLPEIIKSLENENKDFLKRKVKIADKTYEETIAYNHEISMVIIFVDDISAYIELNSPQPSQ